LPGRTDAPPFHLAHHSQTILQRLEHSCRSPITELPPDDRALTRRNEDGPWYIVVASWCADPDYLADTYFLALRVVP
jgi:hypothetical protein